VNLFAGAPILVSGRRLMAAALPATMFGNRMQNALPVKNTFLHFAEDGESTCLCEFERTLKRQESEPVLSRVSACTTEAGATGKASTESDIAKIIADSKAWQLSGPNSKDGDCTSCGGSGGISSEDEDVSQAATTERQTSELSVDGAAAYAEPTWICSETKLCRQETEQMWPTWDASYGQAPQMTWVPTMMVPTMMVPNHAEAGHREQWHDKGNFKPSQNGKSWNSGCIGVDSDIDKAEFGSRSKGLLPARAFPGNGSRRKDRSLITIAQQARGQRRHAQPLLDQTELHTLRKQLEQRTAELTGDSQQEDPETKASQREHVSFCPYCGNTINRSHRFCGYCGEDVSKILRELMLDM
jgi:hypothetical protein